MSTDQEKQTPMHRITRRCVGVFIHLFGNASLLVLWAVMKFYPLSLREREGVRGY